MSTRWPVYPPMYDLPDNVATWTSPPGLVGGATWPGYPDGWKPCPQPTIPPNEVPTFDFNKRLGWECPKCGRVFAPWVPSCSDCGRVYTCTVSGTSGKDGEE